MIKILAIVSVAFLGCAFKEAPSPFITAEPATPKVYSFTKDPIWADEFDTPGLPNEKFWSYDVGGSGWGNNELQYYTKADYDLSKIIKDIRYALTEEGKKQGESAM